jgi:hypothetical protein
MKKRFTGMGAEELLAIETAKMNSIPSNEPGGNPWTKYIIVGGIIVVSLGAGLYLANQFEKNRNQKFKNYGREEDN